MSSPAILCHCLARSVSGKSFPNAMRHADAGSALLHRARARQAALARSTRCHDKSSQGIASMNETSAPPPFRAEHIGSMLRPPELLDARERHAAGTLDRPGLPAIEERAIRDVVKLQEDIGLQVITDGEFRRGTYSDLLHQLGHFRRQHRGYRPEGWTPSASHGHRMARDPTGRGPHCVAGAAERRRFPLPESLTAARPRSPCRGPATSTIAPGGATSAARSTPTSTRSGRTWSRPIIARCARSPKPAAAICRSTRPR